MEVYFFWGGIGVLAIFLLVGFLTGLIRGLKRSALHILFFVASMILAFFITKPITNVILGIKISVDGSSVTIAQYLTEMIKQSVNISNLKSISDLLAKMPGAIASPIAFLLISSVTYVLFDIIYLIVSRIAFGKKKKDFKQNKPYRAYGAVIGMFEGFLLLFLTFAPLNSLTKTYQEITYLSPTQVQAYAENDGKMKSIAESVSEILPKEVHDVIIAYNNCAIGKIAGAGGLDNICFDYLSNFKVNGEQIEFRKELVSITSMYDDLVEVYNKFVDKRYTQMDFTNLKASLENVLDNGIFKGVLSETVNELVLKFDKISQDLNLEALPTEAQDVIKELKTRFQQEGFNVYEYLKHDILKFVDIFECVIKEDLISAFENNQNKTLTDYLSIIDEKNESIKELSTEILSLNIIKDSFNTFGKIASNEISEMFDNEDNLEIGLNINVENKDEVVDELLEVVGEFLSLNDYLNISEFLSTDDITQYLIEIKNLENVLTKLGTTFDNLRDLQVLTLPVENDRSEEVKVFDNILKTMGIDLLKDEVYLKDTDQTKTKIDSYSKFFEFIKPAIITAKDLKVLNVGDQGVDFEIVLNNVLAELKINEDVFADLMIPFYQLTAMDLKSLVFDKIMDILEENVSIISFKDIKTANSYEVWKDALGDLGKTLNKLNSGEVGVENETFLKYFLDSEGDLSALSLPQIGEIIDIVKENAYNEGVGVKGVLNEAFAELIWVLTGDKIIPTADYTGKTQNEFVEDIKAYININDVEDYYTLNYEELFTEIENVVNFVEELDKNMQGITLNQDTVEDFVGAVKDTLQSIDEMTEDDKVEVIENVKTLLENKAEEILTQQEIQDFGMLIENVLDDPNSEISEQLGNALKELLGI